MNPPPFMVVIIAAISVLIIGSLLAVVVKRQLRTRGLKKRFGPEYERVLLELGDSRQVEKQLTARLEHANSLELRALSRDETDRFVREWRVAQAQFVDEPFSALQKVDRLIREVMEAKGYDVEDFEQGVADISVDFPDLVADFRGLHDIAKWDDGQSVETEELRQAMLSGRQLFEKLTEQRIVSTLRVKEEPDGRTSRRTARRG